LKELFRQLLFYKGDNKEIAPLTFSLTKGGERGRGHLQSGLEKEELR